MLIDQLKIAEGSSVINLSFPNGTSFPTSVQTGEVFYRTDESQAYIYSGTSWEKIRDKAAGTAQPYDISLMTAGTVNQQTKLLYFVAARPMLIPANFAGATAAVGSISAAAVFSFYKNNVLVGTLSFSSGGVETFATVGGAEIVLAVNDVLSMSSPAGTMPSGLAITIPAGVEGVQNVTIPQPTVSGVSSVSLSSADLVVSGSPITSSGTITLALSTSGVTAGTYTNPSITVDAKGRVTAVSTTTPVTSFNGRNGAVLLTSSDVISVLGVVPTDNEGTVKSVGLSSDDFTVTGSPVTVSGVIAANLKSTSVVAGSYTYSNITVDAKGRLTAAASGTPVTSFNTRAGAVTLSSADITTALGYDAGSVSSISSTDLAVSGDPKLANGVLTAELNTTAVTAGSYTFGSFTVDSKGRLTAASSGTPVSSFNSRTGAVTLSSTDVTTALGFTPASTLNTLSNVLISSPTMGQVLTYNSVSQKWQNGTASTGLPTQTGNSGKILTTNGTSTSWITQNAGTVTSVAVSSTDLAITGSPITSTGTIVADLNTTAVTAGSYTFGSFTVDSKGRLTAASSGTPVTSFNTRTGAVTLTSADVTTALTYTPGTVTSVNVSGGTTGLTATGGPVTLSGTITLAGTLAVANGGTGGTTATAALTNLLPTQTGNSGKVLSTNGTSTSWATPNVGTVTSVAMTSTDFAVTGSPITSSGTFVANLNTTPVSAGTYTYTTLTVDSKGRLTAAASGTPVTSFNTRTGAVTLSSADITTALGFTPLNTLALGAVSDVTITTPSTGQALTYNSTTSVWENTTLPSGLPSQTGNSGKLLTTNGTAASWGNTLAALAVGANAVPLSSPVALPLQSVNTGSAGLTIGKFSADTGTGSLAFVKSRSTTAGTYSSAILNGDPLGAISTFGDDGSATLSSSQGSGIQFTSTENWNSTSHGSDLRFYTTPNASITKTERLRLTHDGRLALGTTTAGAASMSLNNPLTGSTTAMGVRVNATIMSDVTGVAYGFRTTLATEAAAFTLGTLSHYVVEGTAGAGSTITVQNGYSVPSGMTAATTNIAFNGNISYNAAKANWNFYAAADGWNYFNGNTGVGNVPALGQLFKVGGTGRITGATTAYGVLSNASVNSDVTTSAVGFSSHVTTTSNAFTLPSLIHFNASPNTLGVGSTITNQYGFYANSNMITATNNYGFFSNIGSGTGRWNFYTAGTAQNYFSGITTIGSDVSTIAATSAQKFQVHASGGAGASFFRWAADTGSAAIRLIKSRSTTMGTFGTAPLNGDSLGEISFIGDNTTGTNVVNSAISSAAAEDFTSTANGTNLRFTTTPIGSVTPFERVRISSTGNVLIGTTSDDGVNKLQVNGSVSLTGIVSSPKVFLSTATTQTLFSGATDVTLDYPLMVSKSGGTTITGVAIGSNNADRSTIAFNAQNTASTRFIGSRVVGLFSSVTAGAEKSYLVFDTKGTADASPVGRLTLSEISASFTVPVLSSTLTVGSALSSDTIAYTYHSGAITPQVQVNNAVNASIAVIDTGLETASTKPTIALVKKHGSSFISPVNSGEILGSLEFHGANGVTEVAPGGAIVTTAESTFNADQYASSMSFATASLAGGFFERLRITKYGHLVVAPLGAHADTEASAWLQAPSATFGSVAIKVNSKTSASSTYTVSFTAASSHRILLTTAAVAISFTNGTDGQECTVLLQQDATGARTVTWPSNIAVSATLPMPAISTAPNKTDRFKFVYDEFTSKYQLIDAKIGF